MPPSKYDKAKQEKNEAFKDLLKALEAQDGELTDRIERMEEKVLNLEARNQKDSQPVVSVFADLARQAAWSTCQRSAGRLRLAELTIPEGPKWELVLMLNRKVRKIEGGLGCLKHF